MARLESSSPMSVYGVETVALKFDQIGKRSKVISPRVWKGIGAYLSRQIAEQFTTDGVRFGTPWVPLTAKWIAYKKSHGYSTRILRMTGEMRRSFTGRPMDLERYYKHTATYGSRNKKAVWHQRGTVNKDGTGWHNPPRPIVHLTEDVENEIASRLARYLVGKK